MRHNHKSGWRLAHVSNIGYHYGAIIHRDQAGITGFTGNLHQMSTPEPTTRSAASAYWDGVLDPQNLEREADSAIDLEKDIAFARTPDFRAALEALAPAAWVMDLGAGLGANAYAMAREGKAVVAVDSSLARLQQLKARGERSGEAPLMGAVVADGEALPFAPGTVPAVYTKSVLIHTRLDRSIPELRRVLADDGRLALVEPMLGNPFVALYRRWFAPKAWQGITRYFDAQAHSEVKALLGNGRAFNVKPFYAVAFLAFVFQFLVAWPRVFHTCLGLLNAIDQCFFACLKGYRRMAWFGVMLWEKSAIVKDLTPKSSTSQKNESFPVE